MARLEKMIVERVIEADVARLFGEINGVIKYLKEVAAAHPEQTLVLEEHWTGYEDNEFRFLYDELETDEEHTGRVTRELAKEEYEASQQSAARAREKQKLLEQRQKIDRALSALSGEKS